MFILHVQNETNINATNVYEAGQIALGDNESTCYFNSNGHHGPSEKDELRFIA